MSSPVTMEHEEWLAVAKLARFAMDLLWQANRSHGCCPQCCAPCAALKHFNDVGMLSHILYMDPEASTHLWWDVPKGRVNQAFLRKAWRMTECHERQW